MGSKSTPYLEVCIDVIQHQMALTSVLQTIRAQAEDLVNTVVSAEVLALYLCQRVGVCTRLEDGGVVLGMIPYDYSTIV